MSGANDVLKLIGISVVAIIGLVILLGILLFVFGMISGNTNGLQNGLEGQDLQNTALNNYQYQLDLVKEQTQRIDMYYAAKTSTSMSQIEFQSWLGTIHGLTVEFINRENNATAAGNIYLKYLTPNGDEYNRVINNAAVSVDDVKKIKATYNGNVQIYDNQYGADYGYIPYLQ